MRFLTRAWHAGDLDDDRADAIAAEYQAHRVAVASRLPTRLQAFDARFSVHDALVRAIQLDPAARTLRLELVVGDLRTGYADLRLEYQDVDVATLDTGTLADIARDPRAEALYDEVDIASDGRFEHRWLWWPYRELDVRFGAFDFEAVPRPDREVERAAEPYVEIEPPAG